MWLVIATCLFSAVEAESRAPALPRIPGTGALFPTHARVPECMPGISDKGEAKPPEDASHAMRLLQFKSHPSHASPRCSIHCNAV